MRTVTMALFAAVLGAASAAGADIGGGEITFRVSGAANVLFSHEHHVSIKKLKCSECHYTIYTTVMKHNAVTMADMQKGRSCGACHNGQRAFTVSDNCERCHKAPRGRGPAKAGR